MGSNAIVCAKSTTSFNTAGNPDVENLRSTNGYLNCIDPNLSGTAYDAWGTKKISTPYSVFHGLWTFDIPATQWLCYEDGVEVANASATTITSVDGAAVITGNATNTVSLMESRYTPRYQPNRGHLFSTAVWLPNKLNNGIRDFGLFTAENGVFFRLKADGRLYAVLKSLGTETKEEVIDTSSVVGFDVTKGNVYDIQYQWRGVGNYKFFINLQHVHTFNNLGTLTALSMKDPALPAAFKSTRTTQDVSIYAGCVDITSENGSDDRLQYASAFGDTTGMNGTDVPVITLYNPLQIASTTNTRMIELSRITATCTKKAVFKVWTTRDASAITGETFQTLGNGSFVQCDSPDAVSGAVKATSVDVAKMRLITVIPVQANVTKETNNPFQSRIDFSLVRGDYLVVTATVATGEVEVVMEWGEAV